MLNNKGVAMKIHQRMKAVSVTFCTVLLLLCSGVSMAQELGQAQILSVEPKVLSANSQNEAGNLVNRAEIYPKEIYFGDPIFFLAYSRNITEHAIENLRRRSYGQRDEYVHFICPSVSAEVCYKEQCYSFSREHPIYDIGGMGGMPPTVEFTLQPNEEYIVVRGFFELPTLREQVEEFWQDILKDLENQDAVTITLRVKYSNILGSTPYYLFLEASFDVVIKARPDSEQMILDQWQRATPWDKVLSGSNESPKTRESGQSRIPIGDEKFSPWTFIRPGNRKPSDPNNPTNVQGWLELEKLFQPGVLLDDIVFTRMQLQYYTARTKEDADVMRRAFIDWINAKPRPQRAVYLGTILSGALLYHEGIDERYKELCQAASDAYAQMDDEVRLQSVDTPSE